MLREQEKATVSAVKDKIFYVGVRGTQTLEMIEGGATATSRFFTYLRDPLDTPQQEQSMRRSIFPVQAAITSRSLMPQAPARL